MTPFQRQSVATIFDAYPPGIRKRLLALRELIFKVAAVTDGVGPLEETLKRGEHAYLTAHTRSGSTIRIDWKPSTPAYCHMYFSCRTNLVETFRSRYPTE